MRRSTFLKTAGCSLPGLFIAPNISLAASKDEIPMEIVKEFVSAGHNDLDRCKEMLENTPNLLYARYDWGGGDFEEAIEGAGHVGNKEIANYLISKGARVNLFQLCMLGKDKIVKSSLKEYPDLLYARGPHGFSLLHHAKVGGAEELREWLKERGLTELKFEL